jgi:hypothetical protein
LAAYLTRDLNRIEPTQAAKSSIPSVTASRRSEYKSLPER